MKLSMDRKGQINVIPLVVTAIVGVLLLIVFFNIYSSSNKAAFDATTLMLTGFFGVLIALVIFIGIINVLR